jgi:hypothetical protein
MMPQIQQAKWPWGKIWQRYPRLSPGIHKPFKDAKRDDQNKGDDTEVPAVLIHICGPLWSCHFIQQMLIECPPCTRYFSKVYEIKRLQNIFSNSFPASLILQIS